MTGLPERQRLGAEDLSLRGRLEAGCVPPGREMTKEDFSPVRKVRSSESCGLSPERKISIIQRLE